MNWTDIGVIAIIGVFGIIGLNNGFILSVFRLASFFVSVIISIKFYPKVADILMKTKLYPSIKAWILKGLALKQQEILPAGGEQVKQATAETVVGHLKLPEFFREMLIKKIPNPSSLLDFSKVTDTISDELARVIISIISLILLYILVRIGLLLLKFIFRGIAKLPLFKQMDKLGGFAFGALEGLLTVYIICAVLMLFNAAPWFAQVYEEIENSKIARFFYQNNFIVDWMFPGNKIV